jgi:hypothetical protein
VVRKSAPCESEHPPDEVERESDSINITTEQPPDELVRACALLAFLDRQNGQHVEAVLRWLGVPPEVRAIVARPVCAKVAQG